jgi:hypothetical protein
MNEFVTRNGCLISRNTAICHQYHSTLTGPSIKEFKSPENADFYTRAYISASSISHELDCITCGQAKLIGAALAFTTPHCPPRNDSPFHRSR